MTSTFGLNWTAVAVASQWQWNHISLSEIQLIIILNELRGGRLYFFGAKGGSLLFERAGIEGVDQVGGGKKGVCLLLLDSEKGCCDSLFMCYGRILCAAMWISIPQSEINNKE